MPEGKVYIQSYCTIQNNSIVLNGETVFTGEPSTFSSFSKQAYQHMGVSYPKFFKMDNLSKLAFLAAELLLPSETVAGEENNIALIFANKSSSLDTDVKFQHSIADKEQYFPSPAVFVYTLPNICLGEISIRHQLKSEHTFFIFDAFNPLFIRNYANILIGTKKADKVLCGWVEYFNEDYKAFVYLASAEGKWEHETLILEKLYNE